MSPPPKFQRGAERSEEWGLLANSIRQPVRQMLVALVESQAQGADLLRAIEHESQVPVFHLDFDVLQHAIAPKLHQEAADLLAGYDPDADELPVLVLREMHTSEATDHDVARFWAHANQLREDWASLPACLVFFLRHASWHELPRTAADLRSWFVLKLDFRQQRTTAESSSTQGYDLHRGDGLSPAVARQRLPQLEEALLKAENDGMDADTLAHTIRLPLLQALLSLGYLRRAKPQYEALKTATLPASARYSWLRLATLFCLDSRAFDEAKTWLEERLTKAAPGSSDEGEIYHQLGIIAEEQRDFATAEDWYRKSLAIDEAQGNEHGAAISYHQLGMTAQHQRDFVTAESWYRKSLAIKEAQGNEHGAASTYHHLGIIAEEQRDFTTAEDWYRKSLAIFEAQGDEHRAAQNISQLGKLSGLQEKYVRATQSFVGAVLAFQKTNDPHWVEKSTNSFLATYREAPADDRPEMRRIWIEAGLPADIFEEPQNEE